jgi:hypothetical protein
LEIKGIYIADQTQVWHKLLDKIVEDQWMDQYWKKEKRNGNKNIK